VALKECRKKKEEGHDTLGAETANLKANGEERTARKRSKRGHEFKNAMPETRRL